VSGPDPSEAGTAEGGKLVDLSGNVAIGGRKESESEGGQEATVTVLAMFLLIIGTILILLGTLLGIVGAIVILMGVALIAIAAVLLIRRALRHRQ
jgi:hypothetical protein